MPDERRQHVRIPQVSEVFYSDAFVSFDPEKHRTTFIGQTVDISRKGACIMTRHFFEEGLQVKVSFKDLGNVTTVATVQWCSPVDGGSYKVGLHMPYQEIY